MNFLKQLMQQKINECNRLAQVAADQGDWSKATDYEINYFRLMNQFIERFGS